MQKLTAVIQCRTVVKCRRFPLTILTIHYYSCVVYSLQCAREVCIGEVSFHCWCKTS